MPTIDATSGGAAANSYESVAEANVYFDSRIPLSPPWVASGEEAYLITATRLLDAMSQARKTLVPPQGGEPAYYRVARQWTGMPATKTQRLAWPRVGMFDENGNPLNWTIQSASVASPTVVTTSTPHGRQSGDKVLIFGSDSVPTLDGERVVTVISSTSFSVPVNVTTAATQGGVSIVPQALKDAESEFAGQLLAGDRSLDNSVIVQGLTSVKAGSVALTFKNNITPQVVPDAVLNAMPQSWLTDELYVPANTAQFDVVSGASQPWPGDRSWW